MYIPFIKLKTEEEDDDDDENDNDNDGDDADDDDNSNNNDKRHDRVSAQLHFNICKETGIQLEKNPGMNMYQNQ